jgi:hypothetical protein
MSPDDERTCAYYIGMEGNSPPGNLTEYSSLEFAPLTISDWLEEHNDYPVVFELSVIQSDLNSGRQFVEQIRDSGLAGLGIPPVQDTVEVLNAFPDQDISLNLDEQTGPISISRDLAQGSGDIDLSISIIGYIMQFRGRSLAHNSDNQPVIVEWQPRSTSGRVIVSLVQITRLAVTGNEQHRRELVQHLGDYIASVSEQNNIGQIDSTDNEAESASITRKHLNNGLLALYILSNRRENVPLSLETFVNALPEGIEFDLSDEEWDVFLSELEEQGIINRSGIDKTELVSTISDRNLTSYTRRLLDG